jgi:cation transport regulator ChaB
MFCGSDESLSANDVPAAVKEIPPPVFHIESAPAVEHPTYRGAQLYYLLSAVRGADNWQDHDLHQQFKHVVTERIRSIVFGAFVSAIHGDYRYDILDGYEVDRLAAGVARAEQDAASSHYLTHLLSAVVASKAHPLWGGHAAALANVIQAAVSRFE